MTGNHDGITYKCELNPVIRKSEEVFVTEPAFCDNTNMIIRDYLGNIGNISEDCKQWKMLKYNAGHFLEHVDKQVNTETLYQVATQILIPPKSLCCFEGGILEVKEKGSVH